MESLQMTEQIHLSDYWDVIKKRKTLIIVFLIFSVAITLVVSFLMRPVYQASARMAIEREATSSPITGQSVEYIDVSSQILTFNTHFKLIKSKPVLETLLKDLNSLEMESEVYGDAPVTNPLQAVVLYFQRSIQRIKINTLQLLNLNQAEVSEQEVINNQIDKLLEQITISQIRDTRLLTIDVLDNNASLASKIANLLAKKYIEFDLASRLKSSNENLAWLNKEVYALKKRLEDDERAFYEYKQKNKVFSITGKQKVIDQKLSDLNNEYLLTKTKRQDLDAKLDEINRQYKSGNDIAYIRSILDNKSIDDIYANLTSLELEMSRTGKVFKSKHPKIQQLRGEISKVKAKLKGELSKEIENLKVQQIILLNREKVMEKNIAEFEQDALNTSGKELKFTILQRAMDTSQNLYDSLVSRIKESGVVSGGASSNIRIVEYATVPTKSIKPDKKKNFIISLLLGLFGGVGLSFFLEYTDQTLRTEEEVQKHIGLPVLSVIPVAGKDDDGGNY